MLSHHNNTSIYPIVVDRGWLAGLGQRAWRLLRTRKAARCLVAAATLVVYVRLRSFLAVDQLVRIYREVGGVPARRCSGMSQIHNLT